MTGRRLLICDDEPAFGRFVRTVAEGLGYRVLVTNTGKAFIAAYDTFRPTTIILDMIMPEMDGHQLVLWLAKRHSKARVIIITGFVPDFANETKVLARQQGLRPVVILNKPLPLARLRAVLGEESDRSEPDATTSGLDAND
ncbi:MAG: response regulator [Rhodospirillales bacterium]